MSIGDYSFKKMSSFLQDGVYYIPEYQRGYSWEEEQLLDYWGDLIQLYQDEQMDNHFLGQIVVHNDKELKRKYIIDGQQRTSTAVILLDVFRDFFYELDTPDSKTEAGDITIKYIGRHSEYKKDLKLVMGGKDKYYFQNRIQVLEDKDMNQRNLSKSEQRIEYANRFFTKKINEYLNSYENINEKFHHLFPLYETFINHFQVMYVETDDINEAFIIFETLNARGKELETADLLKNHLYRIANDKIDEVQTIWEQTIETLGKNDPTKYIRHYWNSKYRFIREKDLYKALRYQVKSPQDAIILVKDLAKFAELYSAMNTPDETTYYHLKDLNSKFKDMKTLGATSYYPIVLALENVKMDEKGILKVLTSLETLVVRNFIVAGKVANRFETEYSKLARMINDGQLRTEKEVTAVLRKQTINDEDFKTIFSSFTVKKKPVIRYLYRMIESYNNQETRITDDNSKVHIEHIMPRSLGSWDITKETHEEYLNRFGNLTMLGEEYNKSISNKDFDIKKEMYRKSKIEFTKSLAEQDKWTIETINQRQAELAELAVKIWPLEKMGRQLTYKTENQNPEVIREAEERYNLKDSTSLEGKINRDYVIKKISEKLMTHGYEIFKGSREEGQGIIIKNKKKSINMMLRISKDYSKGYGWDNQYPVTGWSVLRPGKYEKFDAYLFVIYKNNEVYYFLLNQEQFNVILTTREPDKNGNHHFYFAKDTQGNFVEHRNVKNVIDANPFYNNWKNFLNNPNNLFMSEHE